MIDPGRNGLLIKPDSPFGLACALDHASADPVMVQHLGRLARGNSHSAD